MKIKEENIIDIIREELVNFYKNGNSSSNIMLESVDWQADDLCDDGSSGDWETARLEAGIPCSPAMEEAGECWGQANSRYRCSVPDGTALADEADADADADVDADAAQPGDADVPAARVAGSGGTLPFNSSVQAMQRILMDPAHGAAATTNLSFGADGKWGRHTNAAWIKFIQGKLTSDQALRVARDSSGSGIRWAGSGHSAASEIMGKTYDGTPSGALQFITDIAASDSPAVRVATQGGSGAAEVDPIGLAPGATGGTDQVATQTLQDYPILDSDGNTVVILRTYPSTVEKFRRRGVVGRFFGSDLNIVMTGAATSADEKFQIIFGGESWEYLLRDVTGLAFEETERKLKLPSNSPLRQTHTMGRKYQKLSVFLGGNPTWVRLGGWSLNGAQRRDFWRVKPGTG